MANSYRDLQEEGCIGRESRDMESTVLIGRRSAKTKTYHEIGDNSEPKCCISDTTDNEWVEVSRGKAIQDFHFPCYQRSCKSTIDGESK